MPDTARDRGDSDIWIVKWDGTANTRLTFTTTAEHNPRWSPDGQTLAFLSSREDDKENDQLWLLNRAGGEARQVTDFPAGIDEYAWSPDGRQLVVVAGDPDPAADRAANDSTKDLPEPPIVVDRFQFMTDDDGLLTDRYRHLYLVDADSGRATPLTSGPWDDALPAWSPDGKRIAFVSKRGDDADRNGNYDLWVVDATAGAEPRKVTTFDGPDMDPEWGSRAPTWSPDGKLIAYVQGGDPKLIYYAGWKIAVVPADGGPARVLTAGLDRNPITPTWTADGRAIRFLLEDDRVMELATVPVDGGPVRRLAPARRFVSDYSADAHDHVAVLASSPTTPAEVYAMDGTTLRPLSRQNDAWVATVQMAPMEEISMRSKDGTEIHGFLITPATRRAGERVPTVLRIHGGPVWQFYNEFQFEWQILAANGFAVVAANPRGSSGRGEAFARAIWADWGRKDSEDVLAAVDEAVRRGVADPARLGVGGWSYGGILTNQVIARDQRFKAAISGAGQSNALAGYGTDQYVREYEAELGRPWESPEKWMRVSYPFFHADRIVTPTLFLCGDRDLNVPLLNSEQMYQALKSLGRETQLIVYPGEKHGITAPSHEHDRLTRYVEWYAKFLTPKAPVSAR